MAREARERCRIPRYHIYPRRLGDSFGTASCGKQNCKNKAREDDQSPPAQMPTVGHYRMSVLLRLSEADEDPPLKRRPREFQQCEPKSGPGPWISSAGRLGTSWALIRSTLNPTSPLQRPSSKTEGGTNGQLGYVLMEQSESSG
ncbi:hypothetical protein P154DRAFT_532 [Amniculicola lignicola CBS 123094]|uniref:Uncharacterized protein n=1 Tax=Amniculicola lignicola CBS 123094 TaxID=1392246 RepID=A0A6A5X4A5_9PLEO|nr:hypothetical protein P154DRAFT_532 [Amniculicola lignicola CBS 123094]